MNDTRRKAITEIIMDLGPIREAIENVQADEQEYLDNMPESLQSSDKGETAQEVIDALEEALALFDDVVSNLEAAKE